MFKITPSTFQNFSAQDFDTLSAHIFDVSDTKSYLVYALYEHNEKYFLFLKEIEKYISIGRKIAISGNNLRAYRIYIRIIILLQRFLDTQQWENRFKN